MTCWPVSLALTVLCVYGGVRSDDEDTLRFSSKTRQLPQHVENTEETLIWAVKLFSERESETRNSNTVSVSFPANQRNITDNSTVLQRISEECNLVVISKSEYLKNIFILGYDVSALQQLSKELHSGFNDISKNHIGDFIRFQRGLLRAQNHSGINSAQTKINIVKRVESCLNDHSSVEWYSQQHVRRRTKRGSTDIRQRTKRGSTNRVDRAGTRLHFDDPYFKQQWHLVNHVNRYMDINVTSVWERNVTGRGVTVAIVDDGLEWTNQDIRDNYNKDGSWDLNDHDPDPTPSDKQDSNHHGTRCAGEIAAVRNSYCAVGVAYGANVSGIKVLDGPMTDSLEAEAFNKFLQINDIYSCSWGPDDDGKTVDGPHILALTAMRYGIDFGRGGYGSIFVVASGNGGRHSDNCNFDGYANSIYTVTIGAVDETGHMPFYAEECASMLAVTFSSGTRNLRSITTTDWTKNGASGCTTRHSGTSAAAPLAAGMLALMLQVRPCLSWRDVQYIIVMTAQKVDIDEAHWQRNGAGLYHSHKHGFGLMNAWRLVNAAKVWESVPWMTSYLHISDDLNMQITKGQQHPLVLTYTVTEDSIRGYDLYTLEQVLVTVTIVHPCRGQIGIVLSCPSGTRSVIAAPRPKDISSKGFDDWTFNTVRCWGESPVGNWTLFIRDIDNGGYGYGYLKKWKLKLYGTPMTSQQFLLRKRRIEEAMSGEYLNDSYSLPCPKPPVTAKPEENISHRTLKFLVLTGCFCLVLALYETFEYAYCYKQEKEEQRAKMLEELRSRSTSQDASSIAMTARGDAEEGMETRRLLDEPEGECIQLQELSSVVDSDSQVCPNTHSTELVSNGSVANSVPYVDEVIKRHSSQFPLNYSAATRKVLHTRGTNNVIRSSKETLVPNLNGALDNDLRCFPDDGCASGKSRDVNDGVTLDDSDCDEERSLLHSFHR